MLRFAALTCLATGAHGQDPSPVYQNKSPFGFHADVLLRNEWTQNIITNPATDINATTDVTRWTVKLRPRLEFGNSKLKLGVGGEFIYGNDENTFAPPGQTLGLIRDNYDSREARLDLAFLRIDPASWLSLEAGRFVMPIAFTEMIWDRDLRPQGASGTLAAGSQNRFAVTGLWARGSHVFDDGEQFFEDDSVEMRVLSADLSLQSGAASRLQFVASYINWTPERLGGLELMIRRQNTRIAGQLVRDYKAVDAIVRLTRGGAFPLQLVANMTWNVADDPLIIAPITTPKGKQGLWLAAVMGSLQESRGRLEYVYASVDRDATVAAYNSDDFFWGTGWSGHKLELATAAKGQSSVHLIGQLQRFKDSAIPAERDHNVKRFRIEVRTTY